MRLSQCSSSAVDCGRKELSNLVMVVYIDYSRVQHWTNVVACLTCEGLSSNEYGALPERSSTLTCVVLVFYVEMHRM